MRKYLKWKLESMEAAQQFLTDHPGILVDIPEIADDSTDLDDSITEIKVAEGIQGSNTKGITIVTKDKKSLMAKTIIVMAHKARPAARRAMRWDLVDKLDFEKTYIFQAPKVDALSRAKNIRTTIVENNALFTNITPADVTAMGTSISDYEAAQVNPRTARDYKKAEGTDALMPIYKKGSNAGENIYDLVYGYYEFTDPNLVAQLKLNMGIEIEGVIHTGLEAICIDGNPPEGAITHLLQDVEMKIVELDRTALSDIYGVASILKFRNDSYHVEFTKTGFKKKEMILMIRRGQTLQVEVTMERVA